MPILFQSYFGLQQADLISALCKTRAWLQANPPWLQAKYSMVTLKCFSDNAVRQRTYMFLVARDLHVLYRGEHTLRPSAQRLKWSTSISYASHEYTVCGPAACTWASFQTSGAWCVNHTKFLQLNLIHSSVYTDKQWGMCFHVICRFSSPCSVFVCFPNYAYFTQMLFYNTSQ